MDANNGDIQSSDYFSDAFEDYKYMHDNCDNYYNKTEKALLPTRKYANLWNKNIDGIFTDCLFVYELMKCKLEVKIANKRERFNVLNYAFEVKSLTARHILSHADKFINFDYLIDMCMKETEEFRQSFEQSESNPKKQNVVKQYPNGIVVANYIYEEVLEFRNYVSTFVVQQKEITSNLSLHAVVSIREQFAIVLVHIDAITILCDFSDYYAEELDDVHRKYYIVETVDKDFEFYSTHEDWRIPEESFTESIQSLHKIFNVFESELQSEIPMARQPVKTPVIKF